MRAVTAVLLGAVFAGCNCGSKGSVVVGGDGGPDAGGCVKPTEVCAPGTTCCDGLKCYGGICQADPTSGCGLGSGRCPPGDAGTCVVLAADPDNCGGCGVKCTSAQVCTRGGCAAPDQCPTRLTACNRQCVDTFSDSSNCGTCGNACAAGTGCVDAHCVTAVTLDGGTPTCKEGGPPLNIGTPTGTYCSGNLAQVSFRWALCSCSEIEQRGNFLKTDGFNSADKKDDTKGTAGIGANAVISVSSATLDVGGTAWAGGTGTTSNTNPGNIVRQDFLANGPVQAGGLLVGGEGFINGPITGPMSIAKRLHVPDPSFVGSGVTAAGGVVVEPVNISPPCDCGGQIIDIAGIIQTGKAQNDNASIGLDSKSLENPSGDRRLDLPCGKYFLTSIRSDNCAPGSSCNIAIGVHGRAAIFVEGDVITSATGTLWISVDPQAELDLFIGGTIALLNRFGLGSPQNPAQTRIYIAGKLGTPINFGSNAVVGGNFYIPNAQFDALSSLDLYGSMFCGKYFGGGETSIHYDRAVLSAGVLCEAAGTCKSCRDCANQACVNGQCGRCTTSADCCAPLACINGICTAQLLH